MAKPTMTDSVAVDPVAPAAPYLGGKRGLARRLIARIEAIGHQCYAEPFVGMGGVFLRRRTKPRTEAVNDINRDVATLFRILQRHYDAFVDLLGFTLTSRAEFDRLQATDPETLTDLERSARFLYLQRAAFGGKVWGRTFGVSKDRPARFNATRIGPMLQRLHARLAGVVIECLPYAAFIGRYDSPQTLFYLDPPYWGCETDYGKTVFERADFARLAQLLGNLAGRFILSINDTPETRALFAGFDIEAVQAPYSIARENRRKFGELIVSGPTHGASL